MPGEHPRGAPPPTMTGDLQPRQVASGLGRPSQPPLEDNTPATRTTKGPREAGGRAQATELREAQPRQARDGELKPPPLRGQALSSTPGKGDSPQTPPGRSPLQAPSRLAGRAEGSPPQRYSLSIASSRTKPTLDETPENAQLEAAQLPEADAPQGPGTGAPLRPGLPRTEAQPTAKELGFHRCFQETPSSFTSTNYTSPSTTPRPPAPGPPHSRGTSPLQPSSYPEFQASGADSWPPAAENSFPGANFGVPPAEPEPIPKGSRPSGSPRGVSFQFPFPALHGASTKLFPADVAGHAFTDGPLVFAFHQPQGAWSEEAVGTGPAYPLPTQAAPSPLPCYQGQPGGLNPHNDLSGALSPSGAAHSAPRPFSDSLHKSLTKILPERPPSAQDGLGSTRGPPSSLRQRHFPGQAYGASRVDTSRGPLDTELAAPGPSPARLPQLWDPTAAPYPTPPGGPLAATRSMFFNGQPSPGQRLCLPQSAPLPWPQVLPTARPSPHGMEMLSRLPFPAGSPEWQGGSQGALGTAGKTPGPREKLPAVRGSQGGSPALFTYNGMTDPGPPPRPRGLRTQAPESRADPAPQVPRAAALPEETRSSQRLRLPPRKDPRKRKARGGTWGKELILRIVQQKNKRYRRLGRQAGRRSSLAAERPQPRAEDRRLREYDFASESEEDEQPPQRGPGLRGRRCRGEKTKEVDLTQGPRDDEQQKPGKAVRQEAGRDRAPPNPEEPGRPRPGPSRSPQAHGPSRRLEVGAAARERGPKCADRSSVAPKDSLQVPTNSETSEETRPSLDSPQEAKEPEIAKESPPDTTEFTEALHSPPAACVGEMGASPRLLTPEQPQPSRHDTGAPKLSGSLANRAAHGRSRTPGVGSLLGGPGCTQAPVSPNSEDPPAHQPGEFLAPMANASSTACPKPSVLSSKISSFGCDPAGFNGDPLGIPVAKKGPQPYSSPHSELFLGPKDLAGCFLEELHPKPSARDALLASSSCLCQDGEDADSLEPQLPKSPPGTDETDPGRAASPLTLESTSLFPDLPVDRFDPPLYGSLSANRDSRLPLTCADPPQKTVPSDPPYPSFLLLEEVSPMLPSHFPNLSGGKVLSKTCPPERTVAPGTAPSLPGKGSGCSVAVMSHLSEDELEIQKLVTELESQLQRSKDTHGAPRERGEPGSVDRLELGTGTEPPSQRRTCQATVPHKDTFSAADLTRVGESTAHREGAELAVATVEGVQGRPGGTWPCPASFHPGDAALLPCAQEDLVSGAPFSSRGANFHFQPAQKARASKTGLCQAEGDSGPPQDVCLPDPSKQPGPQLDAESLAKCSPDQELSFPKNKEAASSQESEDSLRPLPCEQRGGFLSESGTPPPPRQEAPAPDPLAALVSIWPLTWDILQAEQVGTSTPTAGRPGFEGNELAPPGASSLTVPRGREAWLVPVPSPACVSNTHPSRRSQDPALSPIRQLQLPGPGAAESTDGILGLQGLTPAAQSPPRVNPSGLEGGTVEGGKVACGPAQGSPGGVQVTTLPAVAGHQLGLEADGHQGLLGQAEKTQGQGTANRLQPENRVSPGGTDNHASVSASPKTALASPAEGAVLLEKRKGSRAAMSLQKEAHATRAQGGLGGQLPESPSCRDPAGPQHLLACSPAWAPLEEADGVRATTDTGAEDSPVAPLSLTTSPCDPKEALARCLLQGEGSPLEDPSSWHPGSISAVTCTHGGDSPKDSTLRIPEDSRKEKLWESPGQATSPRLAGAVSPSVAVRAAGLSSTPTEDEAQAGRGLPGPDPQSRGAPPHTNPDRMPRGHSSYSPSNTARLGHREGQAVTAVPTEPPMLQGAGPDSPTCLEGEMGTSSEEPEEPGTPETGHSGVTKMPRVTCPSTGLCLGRTTAPSSTARDFQSDSPQSHRTASHQTPQGDPLSPQDLKQRPRGYKKKPASTENGQWKGQAPHGPVTCEVCAASFRSGPGLSRHKARKHRPHPGAPSEPSPADLPAQQPLEPLAQKCQPPRKKSRKVPGKERPNHSRGDPSHVTQPPPAQGSKEVLRTPGSPHSQQRHPPSPTEHAVDVKAPASKPRPDQAGEDELHPKQAEKREGRRWHREPTEDSPSHSEGKSNKKKGKPRGRRLREESAFPVSPDVISDGCSSRPSPAMASYAAPPSHCLSVEGGPEADREQSPRLATLGPGVMEGAAETDLEALCAGETGAQKPPGDGMLCPGRMDGAALGEQPAGQKGASARGFWGPRETKALGVCKESGSEPAEDSSGAHSRSEEGVWENTPPLGPLGFPETSSCPADSTTSSCLQGLPDNPDTQGGVQGPEGRTPDASSSGSSARDPPSLFDDEVSFSQLFPPGGRLTRKRNPRVYGKRCEKPVRPLPTQPSFEEGGGPTLGPARLPTDLSDSGSLCLCHEDPWEDEDPAVCPSLPLDGFLNSRCLALSLELPAPADDSSSSLGDVSPEPPSLERERCEGGLPGNTHLLPLRASDFEVLSTKCEMQDLCFLEPFEDPVGLPGPSFLDFEATASSQGPQSQRTEETAGAGRAQGRGRPAKGKRASYKCRVCFQRFRSLGELDLHKLAHTPAPPPTCYMCVERRFGSRELLRGHLQERHAQSKAGPWACGMCLKEVADVWMYNEHLREHAVRFARRGQARRSLGDLPGGLEGSSAVAHLLNSIMEPAPKHHRGKRSVGKAAGTPGDPSGQEGEARKESPGERAKPRARSAPSNPDGAATPDSASAKALADSGSPGPPKTTPSPSPDPWAGGEPLPQATPVHEACKDPSRDCHHCGKRFPKPFKLQRHLAVHSPQRVYLCPRCPRVYPEHGELLAHLGGAHGLRERPELQHTPLYACELCATVMRIIKKSFACSSCNYTFAKKEQFDRHMDKHLRRGRQPFTFRGVRRPGAPGQKARVLEGTLPSKRRRVAMPGSAPGPSEDRPLPRGSSPILSEGSLPALLHQCSEVAPSTTKGWPETLERPVDPVTHPIRGCDLPSNHQECPPPSLSPFPAALADGRGDCALDEALEKPENEASPGIPGPLLQQALPLGASLPRPGARGQDAEGKRAPLLFSGKRRAPGARGRCAPDHFQEDHTLLQKEKEVSSSHMVSERGPRGAFHKGSTSKPAGCQSSSKDRSAASTPGKAFKFPVHPRKAVGSLAPGELARGTENGMKPTTPKAKPGPSSQDSGSPRPGTKTGGGSQPQPASGQLQSETATTPAKPSFPSRSPAPDRLPPRAQAKSCTKGPREAGEQGPHGSPGPKEKGESSVKRKKGQVPGPARSESVGSFGRAPLGPDKPPRTPRKQATPSRVLPTKPNSQNKPRPPPSEQRKAEPGHTHRKDRLGKAFPQGRPLLRPPKRGTAVHGAEPAEPHTHRTAEAQSDLLSQLFGQRLTGFKIPLKKDASE
uniref:Zinc finger protein 469 n=1 Tax=Nomascus leucogenys TaxID=61853 RepID=A0A2I3GDA4_NOMLE